MHFQMDNNQHQAIMEEAHFGGKAGDMIKVDFVIPADGAVSGGVFAGIIEEAQNFPVTGEEGNDLQLNAHYMAAICCFIPSLVPSCKLALNEFGADPNEVFVRKQVEEKLKQSKNLIIFGQLALLAYKDEQRTSAIKALVEHYEGDEPNNHGDGTNAQLVAFDQERAKKIRAIAGCNPIFKRALLRSLIDLGHGRGRLGHVCKYVCRAIAWQGMDDFVAASDILLATKSPVLTNYKVANEVKALKEAFDLVNNSEFPQFFNILAPACDQSRLSSYKFPTLLCVAERIRGEKRFPFNRTAVSNGADRDRLVMQLVAQHKNYMRNAYV